MTCKTTIVRILGAWGLMGWFAAAAAAAPWDKLITVNRIDADPKKNYVISESNGPWMIMACSFRGPTADREAHDLVLELRKRYKLPAYQYEKRFDFGKNVDGLGIDKYGNPRKMKLLRGISEVEEIAVMVGDYPTAEDPDAQETLKKLKYYQPDCLALKKDKTTSRTLAALRTIQADILSADNEKKKRGPMGHAFVTPNPLLPAEFFAPKGIDEVVLKANEGVEHCLLDCPGKFTVQVATFAGRGRVIVDEKTMHKEVAKLENQSPEESQLVRAALKAHKLTMALRKEGVEAYEFHDRSASIVTVGSFNSVGNEGPNGQTELSAPIQKIMNDYKGEQKNLPQYAQGVATVPKSRAGIPFDIQPLVVNVPKRPVSLSLLHRRTPTESR
jgi:hypothetical protein